MVLESTKNLGHLVNLEAEHHPRRNNESNLSSTAGSEVGRVTDLPLFGWQFPTSPKTAGYLK